MFGKNEVAKARHRELGFLVKEIFYTIQGEGPFTGQPAVFVRLGGCNLRCVYCDTDFTTNIVHTSVELVCEDIRHASDTCPLVVITGGEPMLQNLPRLILAIRRYLKHVKHVQIETAGTVWPEGLEDLMVIQRPEVDIVVSPKTAKLNPSILMWAQYWKYIVDRFNTHADDGLPCISTQLPIREIKLARPPDTQRVIYVQPMDEGDASKNAKNQFVAAQIAMKYGYRISVQVHKILELP